MNRQSIGKLSLFLTGLEQRIEENREYFKQINVVFKSGTKEFPASVKLAGNKLNLNFNGNTEVLELKWMGARIAKHAENYDSLVLTYEERGTTIYIEADNKNVKMHTKETEKEEIIKPNNEASTIGNREYIIKVGQADALLKEIGILGPNGKVKNDMIRKYNQIDHFIELISGMLISLAEKYESITVIDSGCGKSYLTFVLNYYIKEVLKKPCHFIGLDYSSSVIEASKKMAQNLGYNNMEFKAMDIKDFKTDRVIHFAISLHACDTATDAAIALAVNNNVKAMVMVPCCHSELLNQYDYEPFGHIIKYGILKARIADALTDGMRALLLEAMGYKVSIVEYISPLETPKNLMIRAEKTGAKNQRLIEEYKALKRILNVNPSLEKLIYNV